MIGEKNTDLKRLKLHFLTKIGRLHWNQGEEVAHFDWFGVLCLPLIFMYNYKYATVYNYTYTLVKFSKSTSSHCWVVSSIDFRYMIPLDIVYFIHS